MGKKKSRKPIDWSLIASQVEKAKIKQGKIEPPLTPAPEPVETEPKPKSKLPKIEEEE